MLHSSFWHHAALDLDLSACWLSVLQPLHDGRNAAAHSTHQDPLFLDFLYPARTLALMRRLSHLSREAWQARQMRLRNSGRMRQFSSRANGYDATDPPPVDAASGDTPFDSSEDASQRDPFEDISPMPMGDLSELDLEGFPLDETNGLADVDNAPEMLRSLLDAGELDSRMVWVLWQKTDTAHRTPDLSAAVLDYLCSVKPFTPMFAQEATAIFDALDAKDRRPSSYHGAVTAYLLLNQLGKAALAHEHGIESGHVARGKIGTSELLASAIEKERWQLAIEVYTEMTNLRGPTLEIWSVAKKNLEMCNHAESFLLYLRWMRRLTGREPEDQHQIRTFATDLGAQAIRQHAPHSSSASEEKRLYRLLMRLKQSAFLESRHYEYALRGLLASPTTKEAKIPPMVVRKLYTRYIAIAKADRSVVPSQKLFAAMLYALTGNMTKSHGTRGTGLRVDVGNVAADMSVFHGRPSNKMLELLMDRYARVGDVTRTKSWFRYIPIRQRKPFHLEYILEAHARCGATEEAKKVFEDIKQMLGRDPHVRAWNMLLHGYARNDDAAGAYQVFDNLMSSSVEPDAYSFTAILDLMALRGDVDGIKDMLALAASVDDRIIRSTAVAGYLVTAFINNDDMDSAELVAEQLRKRRGSEHMQGSMTPIWNNIATAYALRRDVMGTRRVYERMLADGVEPDEFTYAALLQALCLVRNSDAAWKILRLVIPQKPVKQLSLHYAIVMAGYINQRKYERVAYVDKHRKQQGIRASLSTKIAAIKAVALSEHVGRYQNRDNLQEELVRTEKMLAHVLSKNDPWEYTAEPQTGLGFRTMDQSDGAYVDIVIEIYGARGAFSMAERLLQEWVARNKDMDPSNPARLPPLRMIVALMSAHFKAERYDEVERLWDMALEQVAQLTQLYTPKSATHAETENPSRDTIAPARRHLLSRPLVIFLRTLHFQGRYDDAQRTVSGLLAQGFTLDNLSWNLYIQLLARTGRISLAFGLCEKYLMPQWAGWRKKDDPLRRRYRRTRGWDYMNVNANTTKPHVIMPQYRTLVILAAALKYVRRLEAVGGVRPNSIGEAPFNEALLRLRSPRTVAALHGMPHIDDELQSRFLGDD